MSAKDLSLVEIVEGYPKSRRNDNHLTATDLMWQEERKRRGVRKLDFEVR